MPAARAEEVKGSSPFVEPQVVGVRRAVLDVDGGVGGRLWGRQGGVVHQALGGAGGVPSVVEAAKGHPVATRGWQHVVGLGGGGVDVAEQGVDVELGLEVGLQRVEVVGRGGRDHAQVQVACIVTKVNGVFLNDIR